MDPFAGARSVAYCRDRHARTERWTPVAKESTKNRPETDTDRDRYPELSKVFSKILEAEDIPQGAIERVEVSCLAGGDATYRVYTPRAEEPIIGYFPKV
jgi:hypothetical protein